MKEHLPEQQYSSMSHDCHMKENLVLILPNGILFVALRNNLRNAKGVLSMTILLKQTLGIEDSLRSLLDFVW